MMKFVNWVDVRSDIPVHFKVVYIKLKSRPDEIHVGCYCGTGGWSCLDLKQVIRTDEIDEWAELSLD